MDQCTPGGVLHPMRRAVERSVEEWCIGRELVLYDYRDFSRASKLEHYGHLTSSTLLLHERIP